jgi:hypothetical protein
MITLMAGQFNMDEVWNGEYNWEVGDPIVIWKRGAQDAVTFEAGEQLWVNRLSVDSALHYAIKVRGVQHVQIEHCSIEPIKNGMISGSADGIDIQQSSHISIRNNRIVSTGDDMISLLNHGHGHNGLHHESKFSPPYPETNTHITIENNDLVGGNRNGMLILGDHLKVTNNHLQHFRQYGLKFTGDDISIQNNTFAYGGHFTAFKHIKDEQQTGIICSDDWTQSNVIILSNTIKNWSHMPGILLKSVAHAYVSNNLFSMDQHHKKNLHDIGGKVDKHQSIQVLDSIFKGKKHVSTNVILNNNRFVSEEIK